MPTKDQVLCLHPLVSERLRRPFSHRYFRFLNYARGRQTKRDDVNQPKVQRGSYTASGKESRVGLLSFLSVLVSSDLCFLHSPLAVESWPMPVSDFESFRLTPRVETYLYRTPMKFGGRVVRDVAVLSVDCDGTTGLGQGLGTGSMTMGVAWGWPDSSIDDQRRLEIVVELSKRLALAYNDADQTGHPMDVIHRMQETRGQLAAAIATEYGLTNPIPDLAVLLASSPIESALFDAHGKAAGKSSYELLSREHLSNDMAHYLGDESYRGVFLDDLIASEPTASLPLYHLVGALDPLDESDLDKPVGDGIPETLGDWIKRDSLTHLKIKLDGANLDWDVERVKSVHRIAVGTSATTKWAFSLDFNERCENEEYVLSMLDRLSSEAAEALACVQYIEQPTARDLEREGAVTMHRVAKRLPVVIDESLTDLRSLRTAVSQGYSGIALKACKGHAEALLLGAVARHEGLFLCVQDLTCVGASLLHSASLAAHIPGVAAVESNGRQYCPAGNERWLGDWRPFFEIRDGNMPTEQLDGPGLGYGDDPALPPSASSVG